VRNFCLLNNQYLFISVFNQLKNKIVKRAYKRKYVEYTCGSGEYDEIVLITQNLSETAKILTIRVKNDIYI
jgi:hypothetical protein